MYVTSSFFIPFTGDWHIQRQVLSQVMTLEVTFRNPEMRGVGSFWKDVSESHWNKFLGPGTKVSYQCKMCKYTSLVIYLRLSPSISISFFGLRWWSPSHCSGLQSTWRCEAMQKNHLNKSEWNSWTWAFYDLFYFYMGVSENGGFSPQIIHFNRVFHYKPSILGIPLFLETPILMVLLSEPLNIYELGLVAFIEPFLTNPKIR